MSRTMTTLIVLALTYGALGLWGYREHERRLLDESNLVTQKLLLSECQDAAKEQNAAIRELEDRSAQAQSRAESAKRAASAAAAKEAAEHKRLQALIGKQTQETSCDAAWDEIEKGQ